MNLTETHLQIETGLTTIPALMMTRQPDDVSRATILVYHGLGADKSVQRKELGWLAVAGFRAICLDLPHHGERRDNYLDRIDDLSPIEKHLAVMQIVAEGMLEIPAIVTFCLNHFQQPVGVCGISLGGFLTYGAVTADNRIQAAVPILGSPDWQAPHKGEVPIEQRALVMNAPLNFPESFPPCALFAANAGLDEHVPPEASRQFIDDLQPYYADFPERLAYQEYSQSEHFMRDADWEDVWQRVIGWFDRFVV